MKKSQVIEILTSLDKSEAREFRKWLLSPVHNQREDVLQLYDYLMAGDHLVEDKFLEKERVFRKIFGKEAYNDAKLRQVNHFLTRSLEEYLAYKEWTTDAIASQIPLITQFRKRKLGKLLNRTFQNLQQAQEKQPYRTDSYFRSEYLIQQELYVHLQERQRTPQNNLLEVSTTLDRSYIIEKLKVSCRMLFYQIVYKNDFDFGLLHSVIPYLEERALLDEPAIAIYYYILKAITEQEKDQLFFEKLRIEINKSGGLLMHSEQREVYLMAINYCIGKMNAGEEQFVREAFEWYKQGIESEILIENHTISRWTYLNVVINALRLHEFKWAENFIEAYQQYLEPAHRENFSHFSKAKLLFEQKKYAKAMDFLIYIEYDDILINLNAKSMLLKIYYETDEFNVLESLLESMGTYLKRKEILSYHKTNYQNIIRYTKKLLRLKPYDHGQREKLRKEISSTTPLTEKEWILEQLDKL